MMPTLICYQHKQFNADHSAMIETANAIINEYGAQGYSLTLRQLYYQFVARDQLANTLRNYEKLGRVISAGRRAGLIDWTAIEDRTRNVRSNSHWDSPEDIVSACASQFRYDLWATQPCVPEVWIEKDALLGVIEPTCSRLDVSFFSCRGYPSDSEVWRAGMRFKGTRTAGQRPLVIHLGDHDPSGIDMTRDLEDRLRLFAGDHVEVQRIALNQDQVDEYDPAPNPAKVSDSRYEAYCAEHGEESWELDALEPSVMAQIIEDAVLAVRDEDAWGKAVRRQDHARATLRAVADQWDEVEDFVDADDEEDEDDA
jgi:hypothetical protein